MSQNEPTPRKVRIGLVPVLVLIALIVGVVIWFALSQNSAPSAEPAPAVTSAAPTQPSTPSSAPTPTERPLPTADESLTAELGRGYELRDDRDNIVSLCEATRFVAAYNPYVGAPQPGSSFTLRTTEGPIDITPYSNDVNGYRGVISASC